MMRKTTTIKADRQPAAAKVYVGSLSSKASDAPAIYIINYMMRAGTKTEGAQLDDIAAIIELVTCREAAVGDGRSRNAHTRHMCICALPFHLVC
jgi:hypothetical protein